MDLPDRLAREIDDAVDVWVAEVMRRVRAELPALVRDDEAGRLAAESTRSLLRQFVSALTSRDPDSHSDSDSAELGAPEPALRFARFVARSDLALALLLRSYRLGQELLFGRAAELAQDVDGLRTVGLLTFRYVDSVVGEVTEVFERERDAAVRGSVLRRERMVTRLLAGDTPPVGEIERVLGWRLDGRHLALVGWAAEGASDPHIVSTAMRRIVAWIGIGDALTMPGPAGELHAWVRPSAADPASMPGRVRAGLVESGIRVAVGEPGIGLGGFLASRRQADAARRVARHLPGRSVIVHRDTALLGLLLADPAAAADFVATRLGPLARADHALLRDTVQAYLEQGRDTSATATAMNVHRNTVMRRVARAEQLLGGAVTAQPTETLVALLLSRTGTAS